MSISIEEANKQKQFWTQYLNNEFPVTTLLPDYTSNEQLPNWKTIQSNAYPQVVKQLQTYCKDSDFLWYCFLMAALQVCIYKHDGEHKLLIGSPVQGDTQLNNQQNSSVILPVQSLIDPSVSFKSHILQLKEQLGTLYANQSFWIDRMQSVQNEHGYKDNKKKILQPQIVVAIDNFHFLPTDRIIDEYNDSAGIQIVFHRGQDALQIEYRFSTTQYKEETIQRFDARFQELLKVGLSQVDMPIREMSICSQEEKEQILMQFNPSLADRKPEGTIISHFEKCVSQYPHHTAVVYNDQSVTYKELNDKANLLAHVLQTEAHIQPDQFVAVHMLKEIEYIISILAILKVGGAYLPIDIEYPNERVEYILQDSQASLVLVQNDQDRINSYPVPAIAVREKLNNKYLDLEVYNVVTQDAIAYLLYTSGTTGKPKGVLIKQKSVINLVKEADYLDLTHDTIMLQSTSIVFDLSTLEIWGALLNGGTLVLINKEDLLEPSYLKLTLSANQINTLIITTALFHHLAGHHAHMLVGIKQILTGGEVLSSVLSNKVLEMYPDMRVINAYGPTECTVMATAYEVQRTEQNNISIGKPITGTNVLILNKDGQIQPVGIPGELCITGFGVGHSYLNQPELTAERYVPTVEQPGQMMYKTGDIALWREDGNIIFKGRQDRQLKLRGFRIELGEIENVLLQYEEVREAVVLPVAKQYEEDIALHAFIVTNTIQQHELTNKLMHYLQQTLPSYMIPSVYIQVNQIPLKSSGKVDADRLLEKSRGQTQQQANIISEVTLTEEQQKVCHIWATVLGMPNIGMYQNFFELGGHSLKLIILAEELQKAGYLLNTMDLYKYPTVSAFLEFQNQLSK
ncbi:non-ribosomal peptide synthetase [Paenibacillus nicotianae]|uniref:Non-ribosomal peptide synthetase n=1 Tax=Paenibacillus nicotianae TaxID=1526551 RepID=A0ABW4UV96_9BACL